VRLRDREDAKDATNLILARALAALPTQRGGSFRPWLFSIAHNVVVDAHRWERSGLPLSMLEIRPAHGPSLEDQVVAQEWYRAYQDRGQSQHRRRGDACQQTIGHGGDIPWSGCRT
jgi:DNA-directed RNA polymerase specialized sigma24 family protein